ncbi:hypothetical protein L3X38_003779 [Prunus dulcis]|uniref:Uncharacterized protein n=1 Tax=Prunus dulcis TaxID=3755 RepID=A0AAD4ZMP0_PRUDU|nr:hypothetical protein L3X38_003779 [Prunus dulcis]
MTHLTLHKRALLVALHIGYLLIGTLRRLSPHWHSSATISSLALFGSYWHSSAAISSLPLFSGYLLIDTLRRLSPHWHSSAAIGTLRQLSLHCHSSAAVSSLPIFISTHSVNLVVYTIVNRADPASKRLAPRQPRLLPCRRKTHFRGARHLLKLPTAKPNFQDTCRHHEDLHKVPHWNFVQTSYFHLPINREQYPSKKGNHSLTFTVTLPKVSHQPISPRASALFPAEDPTYLITKLASILAGPF